MRKDAGLAGATRKPDMVNALQALLRIRCELTAGLLCNKSQWFKNFMPGQRATMQSFPSPEGLGNALVADWPGTNIFFLQRLRCKISPTIPDEVSSGDVNLAAKHSRIQHTHDEDMIRW